MMITFLDDHISYRNTIGYIAVNVALKEFLQLFKDARNCNFVSNFESLTMMERVLYIKM